MTATTHDARVPEHPATHRGTVPMPLLWFGLFGAALAWALQLLSNYWLFSHFCYPTVSPRATPTFGGVRLVGIVVSGVLLLVAVAALLTALRTWKRTREEAHRHRAARQRVEAAEVGEGRTRFMAMAGVLVSGIFVYGLVMNAMPLLFMPICTF
jgi:hypothetical protein